MARFAKRVYLRPLVSATGASTMPSHSTTDLLLLDVHERTIMSVLGWSTKASRYTHVITPIHSDLASRLDGLRWSSRDAPIGTN